MPAPITLFERLLRHCCCKQPRASNLVCLFVVVPALVSAQGLDTRHEGIGRAGLMAIDVTGDRIAAGGVGGAVLSSFDGGSTWQEEASVDERSAVLGIATSGDITLMVGQGGKAWRRYGDDEWEALDTGLSERWLNIDLAPSGLAVAVGGFGALAVSTDAGTTWRPVSLDWSAFLDDWYEPHLYDVVIDGDAVTIVGEFGLVLRSQDAAYTWTGASHGDESLFALHLDSDGTGYVVGQDGYIARTSDNAASWEPCAFRGDSNLFGVAASDAQVLAVGMRSILESTDSCQSFQLRGGHAARQGWWQEVVFDPRKRRFLAAGSGARIVAFEKQ